MSAPRTILEATGYWENYYGDAFRFGQGTESILDVLSLVPPVAGWTDLGAGSESLLWAAGLDAHRLTAVDIDPNRLTRLREFAHTARPRGVHAVALALCGRTSPDAFATRCRSLAATVQADCLIPSQLPPHLLEVDLLTQFGLLGLCQSPRQFTDAFTHLHRHLPSGAWAAGANWMSANTHGRVQLTHELYQRAAERAGLHLLHLDRVPSSDPQFPCIWIYLARRTPR